MVEIKLDIFVVDLHRRFGGFYTLTSVIVALTSLQLINIVSRVKKQR